MFACHSLLSVFSLEDRFLVVFGLLFNLDELVFLKELELSDVTVS